VSLIISTATNIFHKYDSYITERNIT